MKNIIGKFLAFVTKILSIIPATIYDIVISKMLTTYTYERLFKQINQNRPKSDIRILDIGIGTAVPLYNTWNLTPTQSFVHGIDIDSSYIQKAQRLFKNKTNDDRQVLLEMKNFYEMDAKVNGQYDIIVFSSSFMLMPFREKALELAKELLKPNGQLYFILTLQPPQFKKSKLSKVITYLKPKLKYLTTIDFGEITYEDEFENMLRQAKLKTTYRERVSKAGNIPTKIFKVYIYETKVE